MKALVDIISYTCLGPYRGMAKKAIHGWIQIFIESMHGRNEEGHVYFLAEVTSSVVLCMVGKSLSACSHAQSTIQAVIWGPHSLYLIGPVRRK
jgi:hypothetical protein